MMAAGAAAPAGTAAAHDPAISPTVVVEWLRLQDSLFPVRVQRTRPLRAASPVRWPSTGKTEACSVVSRPRLRTEAPQCLRWWENCDRRRRRFLPGKTATSANRADLRASTHT